MKRSILLAALVVSAVSHAGHGNEPLRLKLLGSVPVFDESVDFDEPSGLAREPETRFLWSVSDDTKRLFRLDPQGKVTPGQSPRIDVKDLEGITFLPDGNLATVREKSNEILIVDRGSGEILERKKLSKMDGYDAVRDAFDDSPEGKGLEGITLQTDTGEIYVIKEGRPRILLGISADLQTIKSVHHLTEDKGFKAKGVSDKKLDVSGITYDARRGRFWIVSDTGKRVYLYDPDTQTAVSAKLTFERDGESKKVKNAEGVALSADGSILFVVTDNEEKSVLISYKILAP